MAPEQKRRSHINNPPPVESDEDQELFHEEQENDDDEDNNEGETASSDEQEEASSQSANDSDSEPEIPIPTPISKVKPLASKPKVQAPKLKQPQSPSSAETQAKSASKRPAENNVRSPDLKYVKKKKVEGEDAPFSDENKEVKKSLTSVKAKPDDGKAGKKTTNIKKETISENEVKLKPKPELFKAKPNELGKVDERTEKGVGLASMIRYDKGLGEYGLGEFFLRKGDGLMEASKREEFDGKWTKLEFAELELRVKRAELYANHAKLVLKAIKN